MKPVELIVANATHDVASKIEALTPENLARYEAWKAKDDFGDTIKSQLRDLLCQIAHNANDSIVSKALAAIGAPSTQAELEQRIESAREAQRRERATV
jgi:predicted nucleotide-binding protein (sugar kinase/HSP70/actin superfamily)